MTDQNTNMSSGKGVTDSAISDAAEVSKTLISGITPADKGWILGFIIVVAIIVGSDMYVSIVTARTNAQENIVLAEYFKVIEQNRAAALDRQSQTYADQVRRSQEVIRDLAQAVARDSERAGMAALSAIDRQSVSVATRPMQGPQLPENQDGQ